MHCNDLATELLAHFLPKAVNDDEKELLKDAARVLQSYSISYQTVEELTNEYITSIFWRKEDLRWALEEQNIEPTEENIKKYFRGRKFKETLENKCVEAGNTEIVDWLIAKIKEENSYEM